MMRWFVKYSYEMILAKLLLLLFLEMIDTNLFLNLDSCTLLLTVLLLLDQSELFYSDIFQKSKSSFLLDSKFSWIITGLWDIYGYRQLQNFNGGIMYIWCAFNLISTFFSIIQQTLTNPIRGTLLWIYGKSKGALLFISFKFTFGVRSPDWNDGITPVI